MSNVGSWVMGAVTAVMAVAGLFVAARAGAGVAYYGGLVFFVFANGFIFYLIKASFDLEEA